MKVICKNWMISRVLGTKNIHFNLESLMSSVQLEINMDIKFNYSIRSTWNTISNLPFCFSKL